MPGDKVRPVVLTRESFIARLHGVLVVPATTAVRDIPTEVVLDIDDGLTRRCATNFDNVFTLRRDRLADKDLRPRARSPRRDLRRLPLRRRLLRTREPDQDDAGKMSQR